MGLFESFSEFSERIEAQSMEHSAEMYEKVQVPDNSRVEISTEVPGVERAIVIGNPFAAAQLMDDVQGDNELHYQQDCGLTSVSNIARLCGLNVSENDVVILADKLNECDNRWFIPMTDRGGVSDDNIINLLAHYGIESRAESALSPGGSLEAIAQYCENGQNVTMGLNAGVAWNEPSCIGNGYANHQVTVLGAVRDASTGEVAGLYICDSGSHDQCRFVDREMCEAMYSEIPNASIVVTTNSYSSGRLV